MEKADLIIIGGGAAAFSAAIRANELKAKTVMVNTGLPLGGTCVNVGCVPTKALIHAAEILHASAKQDSPGILLRREQFDFPRVIEDEQILVSRMRQEKYEKVLKSLEHVRFVEGRAAFTTPSEISIDGRSLGAAKLVIAAGSSATVPSIPGLREAGFITHIEAVNLRQQPRELIVIGGGPVGLEMAQMYARFGTRVTLLQHAATLFPRAEKALTQRLQDILSCEGISVHTGVRVTEVRSNDGKKIVTFEIDGKSNDAVGDEILLTAGKTPNTRSLGLDRAGVATTARGAIVVNAHFQTSQPNIYAVGDIADLPLRQEPTAGREGTLAAQNALTGSLDGLDYHTVPYTVFTDPELAGVGMTEDEQMRALGTCSCRTLSFEDVPRAIILRRTEGLIKMVVHPHTLQVMGVHVLSPAAGELIATAAVLIKNRNTVEDVSNLLPMFPTLSEAIKLVAMSFTRDISKLSCCI